LTLAAGLLAASAAPSAAYTESTLRDFCPSGCSTDGSIPESALLKKGNKLYGTTTLGGSGGGGVVFRYNTNTAAYAVLWNFCLTGTCPFSPSGKLIIDTSGNLYGTTIGGGVHGGGVAFELVKPTSGTTWTLTTLYDFCTTTSGSICTDGKEPDAGLTYVGSAGGSDYDGTSLLFGITGFGGTSNDGAVFALQLSGGTWSQKVLHAFSGATSDGNVPLGTLYTDGSGNIWGTTRSGGSANRGVAYKLAPGANPWTSPWTESIVYNFCWTNVTKCPDGEDPIGVTMDGSGNLLGVADGGGSGQDTAGDGVVFKLNNGSCTEGGMATFWCNTVLYNFCPFINCHDGEQANGDIVLDGSGNIFGTTAFGGLHAGGTVFEVSGTTETVLYSFCATGGVNCTDGTNPFAGLAIDASADLFGTTGQGGNANNAGVLFELTP